MEKYTHQFEESEFKMVFKWFSGFREESFYNLLSKGCRVSY
jgi:hypothetical protein